MVVPIKSRCLLWTAVWSVLLALVFSNVATSRFYGVSIDWLHWMRAVVFDTDVKEPLPLAVVAIDENTYRTPPFKNTPRVMWTREIAEVLTNLQEAGVSVIGVDMIFPTSVETYLPGFERDFLLTLRRLAQHNRIVLGKVQHSSDPIVPHVTQSFAVGHGKNIRGVNLAEDSDGVVRKMPLTFLIDNEQTGQRIEPSFSVEIASRILEADVSLSESGALELGGTRVPGTESNRLNINFPTHDDAIPVYSFDDLYRCIENGQIESLRAAFAGKAVLLGLVLDVEDRVLTSARLAAKNLQGTQVSRQCSKGAGLPSQVSRDSIPGVFVHSVAIGNMLQGNALRLFTLTNQVAVLFVLAFTVGLLAAFVGPAIGAGGLILTLIGWSCFSLLAFKQHIVVPFFGGVACSVASFSLMQAYSVFVTNKDKRYLRKVFEYYLSPLVVDELTKSDVLPTLGGEVREVTILFSDIAGFTGLSESLTPEALVAFLKVYLTEMTEVVETHGGFVDKYIGDAVVAVFGAPFLTTDHAIRAVRAAIESQRRLKSMQSLFSVGAGRKITARIGVNTGDVLLGNIGGERRFNYTVIGDAVNLAARLESANKIFGTEILIGEYTATACRLEFDLREIDRVRVVGQNNPVTIYEPLADSNRPDSEAPEFYVRYAKGLRAYRDREFSTAAAIFEELAQQGDQVSLKFCERIQSMEGRPFDESWDGVTNLDSK